MAEGLDNVDSLSLARQVALSTLPLRLGWDIERQIFEKGTDDHRLADTLLNSDGRRNAVVVPIPTRDKFGSSGLGIYSDEEETLFDTWWTEQQTTLLHAAIATHLTMQDRDWVSACMKLAPREVECIKWLSKGLRTKQIANKLNLSDAAVSLYLKNARRKMNVATREALVAKCFMAGLI
ncbi:MAG: helix-turn-helix domain-containing protein [Pseudomonadota bacterium]